MVKKYFRPFICAVCTAISVLLGAGNIPMYIAAAELQMESESGVELTGESETEAVSETETEAVTETETQPAESETEPATQAGADATEQTEPAIELAQPATEQISNEATAPIAASVQESETEAATLPAAGTETVASTEADGTQEGSPSSGGKQTESESTGTKESESETKSDTPAEVSFGKEKYELGDEIELSVDKFVDSKASSASLEFDIPVGMAFKEIGASPVFTDRSSKIQYKNDKEEWKDYNDEVDPAEIKGLRILLEKEEEKTGITQEKKFLAKFTAVNRINDDFELVTKAVHEENEDTVTAKTHIVVEGEVADVVMTQTPEAPAQGTEVRQENSVAYKLSADTVLTYTVDPGVDLLGLEFEKDGMFIGGTAVITSNTGETQVEITENLDLKSYAGITSVKLTPKAKVEKGTKSTFAAVLSIREYMDAYTNKLSVAAGTSDNQAVSEFSQVFDIDYSSLEKPVLSYEGKKVAFGENGVIVLSGIGIHSYKTVNSLDYAIMTPEFATIREIKLPAFTGASSISVYAENGNTETLLGEYKPGDTVSVEKDGISGFRFAFKLDGNDLTMTENGSITLASLNENNRVNYFAFRASMKAVTPDTEMTSISDILAVTFELYKKPNNSQTETEKPSVTPQQPQQPQQPVQPQVPVDTDVPDADDDNDDEPSEYDKIKEKEEEKKQSIVDKTLESDKASKEKQKELLAKRIASIRGSAININAVSTNDEAGTEGTTEAALDFEDWLVKPISEGIVENLVPAEVQPIDEGLIENLIPSEA